MEPMHTTLPANVHVIEYTWATMWTETGSTFVRAWFLASDGSTGVHTFCLSRTY